MSAMSQGLRTVIYRVPDLAKAKAFYSAVFSVAPYFDEPFYVGFNIGGFELGLDPSVSEGKVGEGGCVAYWGVEKLDAALELVSKQGAQIKTAARDVGEGIRVASVTDPFGNVIGLIENPNFLLGS